MCRLLYPLLKHLPFSMRDQIKKKHNSNMLKQIANNKEYSSNPIFKAKVHKSLEMFGCRDNNGKETRVNFQCKSLNPNLLPVIEQDSMNSHGTAKIKDVIEYLFDSDGLWKYIMGVVNPKKKSPDSPKANDVLEMVVVTDIIDEFSGSRKLVKLNPELMLDQVKKYFYDLVDIDGSARQMPLYYSLKNPDLALKTK